MLRHAGFALLVGLLIGAGAALASRKAPDPPCTWTRWKQDHLEVESKTHRLTVCEGGQPVRSWPVALGRGGMGKRKAGDNKTPTGRYPLGRPRPSARYHTFIPIDYPTELQELSGYTGDGVGIHGPRRGWRWLGRLGTRVDWTRGCIALATDAEIDALAEWVRAHPASFILIH